MTARYVVAGVLALLWLLVTVANGQLLWDKLRGRESGSFVPFLGMILGVAAVLVAPQGPERLPFLLIPVVLDVGVLLLPLFVLGTAWEKLRPSNEEEDEEAEEDEESET